MFIEPKDVNSLGLLFDIAGAWLVAIEVVNQFRGSKYEIDSTWNGIGTPPFDTNEYKQWESSKLKFMWAGLIFLTIGFSLQIASNYLKSNHINAYPITRAVKATAVPQKNNHADPIASPAKKDNAPIQKHPINEK